MKKTLLFLAFAGGIFAAHAESQVYTSDNLGEVDGVSDNGRYAAVTDPDYGAAYLWDFYKPGEFKDISAFIGEKGNLDGNQEPGATTAVDVSDTGIVVGSIQFSNLFHPAYYKDGKWHLLPLDPNAMNTNEAIAITPDGSVIAGYQYINDPSADQGGRYYPCQWFLQADGSYSLKSYTNIELPDHQGFFPMMQTPDGKIIGGTVYCGIGSRINALIKDGDLVLFDEIETKSEPWIYKGKYYAGVDDDGKQIWVTDPGDPRIVFFPEVYINGFKDGQRGDPSFLNGVFTNCDDNGNLYGARSRVENLNEDADGEVYTEACIYNYLTDTWYTDDQFTFFSAGIADELLFTDNGYVIKGNEISSINEAYSISTSRDISGINKISADGNVLGGVVSEFNPAISQMMYYPLVIVADGSGVQTVAGTPGKGVVIASAGRIEVVDTDDVAVYDLNGRLISTEKVTEVAGGIYIVKAGDRTYKINVR